MIREKLFLFNEQEIGSNQSSQVISSICKTQSSNGKNRKSLGQKWSGNACESKRMSKGMNKEKG